MEASTLEARSLSRGKGRTENPRVYVGCLPCAQGRMVADIEHANIWLETHWKRCPHTLSLRGCGARTASLAA
jgi:hypothetical protein